ncbi:MAG: DUF423 domain-containing protein [Flavobacteriaceae bacterium]
MNKTIFLTGVLFGIFAIVFGAFGAHSLKEMISSAALDSYETGVKYQMYHALLLLLLGRLGSDSKISLKGVYYLITIGVICFSFSIYLLSLQEILDLELGFLGLITPFGGVLLIAGWILMGYRFFKQNN